MTTQIAVLNGDTVLVGVDRSAASAAAVRWAAAEAIRRGVRLHAVHVVDHSHRHDARFEAGPHLELAEARHTVPAQVGDLLFRAGIDADAVVSVVCGEVASRLAHEAQNAGLVVIGAPDGPSQESLPSQLAMRCLCPVRVVNVDGDVEVADVSVRPSEGASRARA